MRAIRSSGVFHSKEARRKTANMFVDSQSFKIENRMWPCGVMISLLTRTYSVLRLDSENTIGEWFVTGLDSRLLRMFSEMPARIRSLRLSVLISAPCKSIPPAGFKTSVEGKLAAVLICGPAGLIGVGTAWTAVISAGFGGITGDFSTAGRAAAGCSTGLGSALRLLNRISTQMRIDTESKANSPTTSLGI